MDSFELGDIDAGLDLTADSALGDLHTDCCDHSDSFSQSLIAAHIAHGMDPVQAALQARLDAPLIEPFLP
jgi:hypothetical protein